MSENSLKTGFGQRLRQARGSTTQALFAVSLGVDPKTLGLYERGERWPDAGFLIRVREITGADLNWLVADEAPLSGPINADVLRGVIQAIEEETPGIDPQSKAKLISRLYSDRMNVHSLGIEAQPVSRGSRASKP